MAGRKAHHGPKKLQKEINEYFEKNKAIPDNITPAGLILHLGINRRRWNLYETKPQLADICEQAKLKIEHYATKRLYEKGRVADIFMLKNMGWTDKQEVQTQETVLIGNSINDEQARNIIERFAHKRAISAGKTGKARGSSSDSETSEE